MGPVKDEFAKNQIPISTNLFPPWISKKGADFRWGAVCSVEFPAAAWCGRAFVFSSLLRLTSMRRPSLQQPGVQSIGFLARRVEYAHKSTDGCSLLHRQISGRKSGVGAAAANKRVVRELKFASTWQPGPTAPARRREGRGSRGDPAGRCN